MIESKKNVPKIFNTSRDFKALMKLLDIITCVHKSDNDNMVSLINPDRCPDKYLPLLASYVGYEYDYNLPYDTNRNIIKYYPDLIRLRGCEDGIKLAAAVAINSSDSRYSIQSSSELVNVNYNASTGNIAVYVYFQNYISKLNDLIDAVRPVGLGCVIVDSNAVRKSEKIDISDEVSTLLSNYDINSYRYKITDENNGSTISLVIPMNQSESITPNTFSSTIPVFFNYNYSYNEDDGNTVSVSNNIVKTIHLVDDGSGTIQCDSSENFVVSVGQGLIINNAFVNIFESGTINYSTGQLTITLRSYDSDGIGTILGINDAIMTYTVDGSVRNSRFRNEIGFGQVDDYSRF